MRAIATTEQQDFAATARALLTAENTVGLARSLNGPGADRTTPALWKALADAGIFGLAIAEDRGGSGGSLEDLAVFCIEAGRALCPTAVYSTLNAACAIDELGGPRARAAWLPPLTGGRIRGAAALSNARNAALVSPALRAEPASTSWRLSGTVDYLDDADIADIVVVSAAAGADTLVFVVGAAADGVSSEPLAMAGAHRAFTVRFDGVVVGADALLGRPDPATLRRLANTAVTLGSLDLVGIGQAAVERTVEYTGLRHQFGRPIASFQAAQHLVADMHIAVAAARLAAHCAAFWLARGLSATRETAIARMRAATAARRATLDAHQLHGGMGYVTETDLHLWTERARLMSTLGGGADVAAGWLEETMTLECL